MEAYDSPESTSTSLQELSGLEWLPDDTPSTFGRRYAQRAKAAGVTSMEMIRVQFVQKLPPLIQAHVRDFQLATRPPWQELLTRCDRKFEDMPQSEYRRWKADVEERCRETADVKRARAPHDEPRRDTERRRREPAKGKRVNAAKAANDHPRRRRSPSPPRRHRSRSPRRRSQRSPSPSRSRSRSPRRPKASATTKKHECCTCHAFFDEWDELTAHKKSCKRPDRGGDEHRRDDRRDGRGHGNGGDRRQEERRERNDGGHYKRQRDAASPRTGGPVTATTTGGARTPALCPVIARAPAWLSLIHI